MISPHSTVNTGRKRRARAALCVGLLTAVAGAVGAQATRGAGGREGENAAPKKLRKVIVDHSDVATRKLTPQGTISTLSGKVKILSEDTVLTTEMATYNEDTSVATSPGVLKMEDPANTLTGNTGAAFYKTRDVKIRDNVVMVIRPRKQDQNAPKGSTRSQFKDPVTVTCGKLDYNWRTRIAEMTGDLTFKQKDRTVTADRAVWDGNTETLRLFGNVHYTTVKGDNGNAETAVAVLKDGAESFTANVITKSVFYVEDDESETGGNGNTPGGNAPGANAPRPGGPGVPIGTGGTPPRQEPGAGGGTGNGGGTAPATAPAQPAQPAQPGETPTTPAAPVTTPPASPATSPATTPGTPRP